uniref:Alternative protein P4HB n=1 Tax=Homo sapiens TaxID=9606 RepID=Q8NI86_HUMAN|nr:OK/SW-CL.24 [Homo sapiens]CCQ43001.1 alternative protein P4HB [Homo sapiens]
MNCNTQSQTRALPRPLGGCTPSSSARLRSLRPRLKEGVAGNPGNLSEVTPHPYTPSVHPRLFLLLFGFWKGIHLQAAHPGGACFLKP